MFLHRPAAERPTTRTSWLESHHTFSFGEHWDPEWRGFSALRVLNDDRVAPARGFGTHPHRDMEILTWVLAGSLEHRDSLGHTSVLRPGDLQRISAGSGITHAEWNRDNRAPLHFLQIWIQPDRRGTPPSYAQIHLAPEALQGRFCTVASREGGEQQLSLLQDAEVAVRRFASGEHAEWSLPPERRLWIHVASGSIDVDDQALHAGDGLGVDHAATLRFVANAAADVLVFALP